jgi:hypothetical protein
MRRSRCHRRHKWGRCRTAGLLVVDGGRRLVPKCSLLSSARTVSRSTGDRARGCGRRGRSRPRRRRRPAVPAVVGGLRPPGRSARLPLAHQRGQFGDRVVDHGVGSLRSSGCRSRADPTMRRAFPAPRSPAEPCPTRPANARSPCAAARSLDPAHPPVADPVPADNRIRAVRGPFGRPGPARGGWIGALPARIVTDEYAMMPLYAAAAGVPWHHERVCVAENAALECAGQWRRCVRRSRIQR